LTPGSNPIAQVERRPVLESRFKSAADLRKWKPRIESEPQSAGREHTPLWTQCREPLRHAILDESFLRRRLPVVESLRRELPDLSPAGKKDYESAVDREVS